ncbi:hypothetical protein [Mesorhizobium sp. M0933]|uniref:hypothetical protein n=1 Tax=unclassified Mesorhizobium TaxID=325217 RepID=UPI00333B0016
MLLAAFVLATAVPLLVPPALAQTSKSQKSAKPQTPKPANIDRNGVLILVRTSLLALDQANKTGNYTVLRDLGAPGFQTNNAAKLAEIFAGHRNDGIDLGGVAVLEPQLTRLPQIEPNGMLHMAGFFPSVPMQVNFELLFAPVERQWKVFGISVALSKAGPEAPATEPEPPKAVAAEPPEPPTAAVNPKKAAEKSGK